MYIYVYIYICIYIYTYIVCYVAQLLQTHVGMFICHLGATQDGNPTFSMKVSSWEHIYKWVIFHQAMFDYPKNT